MFKVLAYSHKPGKINRIINMTAKSWQLINLAESNNNFNITMCYIGLRSHHLTINLNLLSQKKKK